MADTDCAFFYTARSIGINKTILNLANYPLLDWHGRQAVLAAETERESIRMYGMDLLWMLVRTKYEGEFPQPSTLTQQKRKDKKPKEEAEETIQRIVNWLST